MSNVKRFIAREWLIFIVCAVMGLSATYFWLYFPCNHYVRTDLVDVSEAESKQLNAKYDKVRFVPDGYRLIQPRSLTLKELTDPKFFGVWRRQVEAYRRKNIGEMFYDLRRGRGDVWLWFYVLSPYLGLCLVRSVVWSVRKVVTK